MKKFALMGLTVGLAWTVGHSEADAGYRHKAKRRGNGQQACTQNGCDAILCSVLLAK